jgi:hypothetical protein
VVKESLVAGLIGDSRTVIESSEARSRKGLRREILGLEDASDDYESSYYDPLELI